MTTPDKKNMVRLMSRVFWFRRNAIGQEVRLWAQQSCARGEPTGHPPGTECGRLTTIEKLASGIGSQRPSRGPGGAIEARLSAALADPATWGRFVAEYGDCACENPAYYYFVTIDDLGRTPFAFAAPFMARGQREVLALMLGLLPEWYKGKRVLLLTFLLASDADTRVPTIADALARGVNGNAMFLPRVRKENVGRTKPVTPHHEELGRPEVIMKAPTVGQMTGTPTEYIL